MTAVELLGTTFQNPVLLAAGTAGFGREVADVIDLESLGGIVTKAVTPEPRRGHRAPRVAEFAGGMLNAVGLANPGLAAVIEHAGWRTCGQLPSPERRPAAGENATIVRHGPSGRRIVVIFPLGDAQFQDAGGGSRSSPPA